ncbi:hypothetical protein BD310DRAFT_357816 [Dichomitus squalens]|uniref:Uncharacterized protein n=1 Tax=Dichomitus squalens TaxID=114155 RepID=A0A4Q9PZ22_9APHY|nr:hypothetical protein BD310DRAFT_357816 [Dichomitus squalens]
MDDLANSLRPSRLVSSIAQSPALPWEVIERAIDLCSGDKATLCAFALTCSQLHPRSLFVLFTNVDLRSLKQLVAFYHAVQAQSHLQPVVKSLSFPWGDLSESPFPLLSILPGLRNVTFNSIYPVIRDDIQLSQSTLLCGLQSLTIRDAVFRTQTAFLRFLSAFPNIEDLTCESLHLIIHEGSGIVQDHPSCRLQLRTLNILQDVDQHVAELLVHIAQPAITSPPAVPEPARQDRQTSLTWWTPVGPKRLHHAIGVLRGSPRAIRHVTLVLWDSDVGSLHRKCCRPANLELFATLESVLLEYNCHRVLLTVPGIPVLKKRKTISWSDEFSKCFRPVSEKWALTEDVRYYGRWVATASEDSTIILWDAHDAHISQEWLSRDGELLGLAFSPDSRHLASAGGDGNVTIWDISRSSYRVAVLEVIIPTLYD